MPGKQEGRKAVGVSSLRAESLSYSSVGSEVKVRDGNTGDKELGSLLPFIQ